MRSGVNQPLTMDLRSRPEISPPAVAEVADPWVMPRHRAASHQEQLGAMELVHVGQIVARSTPLKEVRARCFQPEWSVQEDLQIEGGWSKSRCGNGAQRSSRQKCL